MSHACKEITLAVFLQETNYPSEKDKNKSGVQTNFSPKFVSSVSTSIRHAGRLRKEVKMNLAPKFLRRIICRTWIIHFPSINSAILYNTCLYFWIAWEVIISIFNPERTERKKIHLKANIIWGSLPFESYLKSSMLIVDGLIEIVSF